MNTVKIALKNVPDDLRAGYEACAVERTKNRIGDELLILDGDGACYKQLARQRAAHDAAKAATAAPSQTFAQRLARMPSPAQIDTDYDPQNPAHVQHGRCCS